MLCKYEQSCIMPPFLQYLRKYFNSLKFILNTNKNDHREVLIKIDINFFYQIAYKVYFQYCLSSVDLYFVPRSYLVRVVLLIFPFCLSFIHLFIGFTYCLFRALSFCFCVRSLAGAWVAWE